MTWRRTAAAVILASGNGTRMGGGVNKVYLPLSGRRVVSWSVRTFTRVPEITVLVLVARPEDQAQVDWVLDRELPDLTVEVVHGGDSRQASELNALRQLSGRIAAGTIDTVLIHDAARPLASASLVSAVLRGARDHGGALPVRRTGDLVRADPDGTTVLGPAPADVVTVQTPQGFRAGPLLDAYEKAALAGFVGTDTSACLERFSDVTVVGVTGEDHNIKITYPHDLEIAARYLALLNYTPD